jgi:hypothetical protein
VIKTNLHLDEKSKRKQPSVSKDVYEFIRDQSRSLNSVATKGVFTYELILTVEIQRDDNFDLIDETEERIDEDLLDYVTPMFLKSIEKIKKSENKNDRIGIDTNSTDFDLELHVPKRFDEKILPDWGANHTLMQKVSEYIHCAYDSRYHRIQVKKDILNYFEDDVTEAETKIGQAILDDDSSVYDVSNIGLSSEDEDEIDLEGVDKWGDLDDILTSDEHLNKEKYKALAYFFDRRDLSVENMAKTIVDDFDVDYDYAKQDKLPNLEHKYGLNILPDESDDGEDEEESQDDEENEDESNEYENIDEKFRLNPSGIVRDAIVEMTGKNEWADTMDVADIIDKNTSDSHHINDILEIIEDESNTDKTSYILQDENGKIFAKAPFK